MTRVLQLTSSYPRNESDTSSIFLRHLFKHLSKNGLEIHVLAPHDAQVQKAILDRNVHVHWFKYFPSRWQKLTYGSGILANLKHKPLLFLLIPFFLVAMFTSLLRLCYQLKPDVIHAHWIIPQGFIAVIVGSVLNIPVITTAHGGDAFSLNNSILSRLKRFTIKHSSTWTSNTSATANAIGLKDQIPKPHIIPMGVDIQQFQSGNANNVIEDESRNIILFVGRLVEKKGVKYLIDAFDKLPPHFQQRSVLWIIGDGDERSKLEKQAKESGISNIKFWGRVQNHLLPDYYAAATVFVAPSIIDSNQDTEGQGVILLEAMAAKKPIIATNVGGIPEVIKNQHSGLLVEQRNSIQIKDSLILILDNPSQSLHFATNALNEVKAHYKWSHIAKLFNEEYESIQS